MMLLYEILNKVSDDTYEKHSYEVANEVYENGYEFEYHSYPRIEGRMSETLCLEVIDILSMMEHLQRAWKNYGKEEKKKIEKESGSTVGYLIENVGFCGNHEVEQLSYMSYLNERRKFTFLCYADDDGNSHMQNLPKYRVMLQEYLRIKHDNSNDFYRGRRNLSVDEVIQILQAQRHVFSHPL